MADNFSMYKPSQATSRELETAFGFPVIVVSSANFDAAGEIRTRYTVRRQNGKKQYHAIMHPCGRVQTINM